MWAILMFFAVILGGCVLLSILTSIANPLEMQSQVGYDNFHNPVQEGAFLRQFLLENDIQTKHMIREGDFFSSVSSEHKMPDLNQVNKEGLFFNTLLAENRQYSESTER